MDEPATLQNEPQLPTSEGADLHEPEVLQEVEEQEACGQYTGHTKWFNDKLGYGFITICDGDEKGKDIFVHHSGIKPLNSNYKTLRKGEYIQFNIINGMNGLQAVDVTGIKGGPLMCDYVTSKRVNGPFLYPPHHHQMGGAITDGSGWLTVPQRRGRVVPPPPPPPPRPVGGRGPRQPKNVAKYNASARE